MTVIDLINKNYDVFYDFNPNLEYSSVGIFNADFNYNANQTVNFNIVNYDKENKTITLNLSLAWDGGGLFKPTNSLTTTITLGE